MEHGKGPPKFEVTGPPFLGQLTMAKINSTTTAVIIIMAPPPKRDPNPRGEAAAVGSGAVSPEIWPPLPFFHPRTHSHTAAGTGNARTAFFSSAPRAPPKCGAGDDLGRQGPGSSGGWPTTFQVVGPPLHRVDRPAGSTPFVNISMASGEPGTCTQRFNERLAGWGWDLLDRQGQTGNFLIFFGCCPFFLMGTCPQRRTRRTCVCVDGWMLLAWRMCLDVEVWHGACVLELGGFKMRAESEESGGCWRW